MHNANSIISEISLSAIVFRIESKKINNLKNKLKSYDEGDISFDDIKKSLEEVLNKNEPILYILNHL